MKRKRWFPPFKTGTFHEWANRHADRSNRLATAKLMPPLRHNDTGEDRALTDDEFQASQVIQWLQQNRALMLWLFWFLRRTNLIKFDPKTRQWSGNTERINGSPPGRPAGFGKGADNGRPTKYSMLDLYAHAKDGQTVAQWQRACSAATGMSERTFYLLLKKENAKKSPA